MPKTKKNNTIAGIIIFGLIASVFGLVYFVNVQTPHLERILNRGELIAVSRNAPTTYYQNKDGYTGIEYDLLKLFADSLNVKLKIIVPEKFSDILPLIEKGDADIGAAGISITWTRKEKFHFSPAYQEIEPQLIYNVKQNKKIKSIKDIIGKKLLVVKGSSHVEALKAAAVDYPKLTWTEDEIHSSEELMLMVNDKKIDFTIADSNEFKLISRFKSHLKAGFAISKPEKLAWALKKGEDKSLINKVDAFFEHIKATGQLTQLMEKHYGHIKNLDTVDSLIFLQQIKKKLNNYRQMFEDVANTYGMDWKLLAAIAYQESHWDPLATSPTGVRGMMMLTRATAGQMGVKNRLDAFQSIDGGVRYLQRLDKKFNKRITHPDRLWFTLASYNVGYGHLEDARRLTQKEGKNPDNWADVKEFLPLLSKKRWHKKTKYGYAPGGQAVHYVQNIRRLHDLLKWYDNTKNKKTTAESLEKPVTIKVLPKTL